jgi:histone deacetylase 1/2
MSATALESLGSSASASSATKPTTGSHVSPAASESASGSLLGSSAPLSPVAVLVLPLDRPRTQLQSGVSQPKKFTDGTIRYAYFCSTGEPSSTTEGFADPRWKATMDEEYDALMKNNTWHLVPSTRGQNVIDCKWVYKIKWKADGTGDRYKARLVAKGFKQ